MNHAQLKARQRAEQLARNDDIDGQFIFLWIAFNAAYATDIDEKYRESAQTTFRAFLELDGPRKRLEALVWNEFTGSIRVLLDNPYVFQDF